MVSLPGLPAEVLFQITNHLSYGSHLALFLTCRSLHAKLEDPNQPTASAIPHGDIYIKYTMEDLLEIERWPDLASFACTHPVTSEEQDFFACRFCLKIRPASKFSHATIQGLRGQVKSGIVYKKAKQLCIECRIKLGSDV